MNDPLDKNDAGTTRKKLSNATSYEFLGNFAIAMHSYSFKAIKFVDTLLID